jgi:hypothetical protein
MLGQADFNNGIKVGTGPARVRIAMDGTPPAARGLANATGVTPYHRNTAVKWLWMENPTSCANRARSAASGKSSCARARQRCSK